MRVIIYSMSTFVSKLVIDASETKWKASAGLCINGE